MKRVVFLFLLFQFFLYAASFIEIEQENLYKVRIEKANFDDLFINLKDELLVSGFTIVHQIDLAKSTNGVAKSLKTKAILDNGITLMVCKSSFALRMLQENIDNITYCPMAISIYEQDKINYISFKKYKSYQPNDNIADEVNEMLKAVILQSLD